MPVGVKPMEMCGVDESDDEVLGEVDGDVEDGPVVAWEGEVKGVLAKSISLVLFDSM